MFVVLKTEIFMKWFTDLSDTVAKNKIRLCIDRIGLGNLGDHHSIGDGISDRVIDYIIHYAIEN
jgi:putative addiction module killer protein